MPTLNNNDNSVRILVETEADQTGLNDAKGGLEDLGDTTNDVKSKVNSFSENFQDGMKKIAAVTGAVGAGLAVYAKSSVNYLTDLVSQSKNLARQTGMTTEESSKLIAAMQRLGLDSQTASASFRIFAKEINDTRENVAGASLKQAELANKIEATKIQITDLNTKMKTSGDTTGELKNKIQGLNIQLQGYEQQLNDSTTGLNKLGISTQDATGKNKSFYQILLDVADKFQTMPDGAEKTALALDLFGRSGTTMIKTLNQGSQGIQQLADDAEKLGLTLNETNIGAVSDYIKSQKDLEATSNSLKVAVGTLTAPILTSFNNKLNDVAKAVIGVNSPLRGITASTIAFGGPILSATSGVAAFLGNIGSAAPVFKSFGGVLAPVGAALGGISLSAVAVVAGFVAVLAITALILNKMGALKPAIDFVVQAFWIMVDLFWKAVKPAVDSLSQSFTQLKPTIDFIILVLQVMAAIIGTIVVGAIVGAIAVIAALAAAVAWVAAGVAAGFVNMQNKVIGAFNLVIDVIYRTIVWFSNLYNSAVSTVNGVQAWFGSLPGRLQQAVGNLGGLLYNAGRDVIQGLMNGISSKWNDAVNFVKNLGGNIAQSLRDKLGIHSPSLVFKEIGMFTGQGFIDGVNGMIGDAQTAVTSMVNPPTPHTAFTGATNNNSTYNNSNMTSGNQMTFTGDMHFENADAVDRFFEMSGRNVELARKGVTTVRSVAQ